MSPLDWFFTGRNNHIDNCFYPPHGVGIICAFSYRIGWITIIKSWNYHNDWY